MPKKGSFINKSEKDCESFTHSPPSENVRYFGLLPSGNIQTVCNIITIANVVHSQEIYLHNMYVLYTLFWRIESFKSQIVINKYKTPSFLQA